MLAIVRCAVVSTRTQTFEAGYKQLMRCESSGKPSDISNGINLSKVPKLDENDLEEHFTGGSGPGGQSVNKAVNCCLLKHKPTGLVVKVHHVRSLEKNRQIARQLMITKLDNLFNGEESVESQKRRIALVKISIRDSGREKRRALKEHFRKNVLAKDDINNLAKQNKDDDAN